MKMAEVNGIRLHYALDGREDAQALVFANSLGTDFRVWDALVAEFSDSHRIVRYDKRGHGLSEAPPAPYRMTDHVDDLIALLDHLSIEEPIVCGLSVGGMIAQGFAGDADTGARVRGLVLMDTAHKIGTPEMWNTRIEQVRAGGIAAIAASILERWFSRDFRQNRSDELAGWRHMLVRTPLEGYVGTSEAIRDCDLTAGTRTIPVPTLCMAGAEDGSTPPDLVRELAGLIAGARFVEIAGAGHLPCVERTDLVASEMRRFFATNGWT